MSGRMTASVFTSEFEMGCPFCRGRVGVGFAGDTPGVLHSLPYCTRFAALSPEEFLAQVRAHHEAADAARRN